MQIPELFPAGLALQPGSSGALNRAWTVGQLLSATVVRQEGNGNVTLRVGNEEVQARTGLALSNDQPLTLQVAEAGQRVVLRLVDTTNLNTVINEAWRQVLPKSGDLGPALNQLARALLQPAGDGTAHTETASALLRSVLASLPEGEQLGNAAQLRRALEDSGLFLEAKLLTALIQNRPPQIATDLKALLLQLRAALTEEPPSTAPVPTRQDSTPAPTVAPRPDLQGLPVAAQRLLAALTEHMPLNTSGTSEPAAGALHKAVESALARIEQNQLASLPRDNAPWSLTVDLPVRQGEQLDVLKLVIERDAHGTAAEGEETLPFTVWLQFDFPETGALRARLAVRGDHVGVQFWADQPGTVQAIESRLTELDDSLRRAGLTPDELGAQQGIARRPGTDTAAPVNLVDERA